ncbi:MAG: hypothetical protein WBE76_04950 [Terracidiphilus sp.]
MNRTLRNGYLLLRYIGKDSEESQSPNYPQRAIVKFQPTIDDGAVTPTNGAARVSQDAANEMTVNVMTIVEGDDFISYAPALHPRFGATRKDLITAVLQAKNPDEVEYKSNGM